MQNELKNGDAPLITIITPTYDREELLTYAYRSFTSQSIGNLEWIVLDDSEKPSIFMTTLDDPRVRYHHLQTRLTIGDKRNMAVGMAKGEIIVQFDDDEYYAPHYVETMLNELRRGNGHVVKLSSFFVYSAIYKQFGYWNLMQKSGYHFCWSQRPISVVHFGERNSTFADNHLGYGFSYVFTKSFWEKNKFPSLPFGEDTSFIKSAISSGFKLLLLDDDLGLCIHILHQFNTSKCFPQYMMPSAIIRNSSQIFLLISFNERNKNETPQYQPSVGLGCFARCRSECRILSCGGGCGDRIARVRTVPGVVPSLSAGLETATPLVHQWRCRYGIAPLRSLAFGGGVCF